MMTGGTPISGNLHLAPPCFRQPETTAVLQDVVHVHFHSDQVGGHGQTNFQGIPVT